MKPHALVVGGSGMLKEVCLWLVEQGYQVSVVGRTKKRLDDVVKEATDSSCVHPISVDYNDDQSFVKEIRQIKETIGPITLVVSWIHSIASYSFQRLTEELSDNSYRLFHVMGSAALLSNVAISVPEGCLYRQIVLGFVLEDPHSRWLTNKEIAAGVIKAIQKDQKKCIVGTVVLWEKHP